MSRTTSWLPRIGWGVVTAVSIVYALYAADLAWSGLLFLLDLGPEIKHRGAPLAFVLHAGAGAVALLTGPFQFSSRLRRHRRLHRVMGYAYATGVWVASVAALLMLPSFGVGAPAKAVFATVATTWFGATTLAVVRARARRIAEHRAWMLRSFALSFFFVTFSFWVPLLGQTNLPPDVSYPLGLALAAGLNLAWVEVMLRGTKVLIPRRPTQSSGAMVPCA